MRFHRPAPTDATAAPRVSVVVPCYNYARFLPDSVGSALAQDGVDLDVVVVDDASTDESVAVAEKFAALDPRVRVVRHAQNRGHVETSNEALGLATGEFVVKLDADDALAPGALRRAADLMVAHPDVVLAYGLVDRFEGELPADGESRVRNWSTWRGQEWVNRVLRRGLNPIYQPEVMVRRTALAATGGYRAQLRWAEDYNLWLRLALLGSVGRVNGPVQGYYRVHQQSFTQSAPDYEVADVRARVAAVDLFFAECAGLLTNPARSRRIALTSLLRNAQDAAIRARRDADAAVAHDADEAVAHDADADVAHGAVAHDLAARLGRVAPSLAASDSRPGSLYRDLASRVRWRRWRRYGV